MATDKERQMLFKNKGKDSEVCVNDSCNVTTASDRPLVFKKRNGVTVSVIFSTQSTRKRKKCKKEGDDCGVLEAAQT